jgi:hypothetical protein
MDGANEASQENSSLSPGEKFNIEKLKIEFWPKNTNELCVCNLFAERDFKILVGNSIVCASMCPYC